MPGARPKSNHLFSDEVGRWFSNTEEQPWVSSLDQCITLGHPKHPLSINLLMKVAPQHLYHTWHTMPKYASKMSTRNNLGLMCYAFYAYNLRRCLLDVKERPEYSMTGIAPAAGGVSSIALTKKKKGFGLSERVETLAGRVVNPRAIALPLTWWSWLLLNFNKPITTGLKVKG